MLKERRRDDVKLTPSTGAAPINGSVYALRKSSAGKNCMASDVSWTGGRVSRVCLLVRQTTGGRRVVLQARYGVCVDGYPGTDSCSSPDSRN